MLYAGLKEKALYKALYELIELELIKDNTTLKFVAWGDDPTDNFSGEYVQDGDLTYSLVYNLPADVIENGV